VPPTYAALEEYVAGVVASGRLLATDVAREVADLIRGGPVPWHIWPVWRFIAFAAVGTLPEEVRRLYGFRFGPLRRALLDGSFFVLKRIRPFLPKTLRWVLPARVAERRLRGEDMPMPRP
jgi:uncharacterized protein (DUF2236 family)